MPLKRITVPSHQEKPIENRSFITRQHPLRRHFDMIFCHFDKRSEEKSPRIEQYSRKCLKDCSSLRSDGGTFLFSTFIEMTAQDVVNVR